MRGMFAVSQTIVGLGWANLTQPAMAVIGLAESHCGHTDMPSCSLVWMCQMTCLFAIAATMQVASIRDTFTLVQKKTTRGMPSKMARFISTTPSAVRHIIFPKSPRRRPKK